MKLTVLQTRITEFGRLLQSPDGDLHRYKYDMLSHFENHWTFDTTDFSAMYDACLQSEITRRWWKREQYRPKEVMIALARNEEHYAIEAFRELFNEHKLIENRVDRFVFYCDELLRMFKKANPKSVVNNHYHDGTTISLYLAGRFPDKYCLYPGRRIFNRALRVLGAKETGEKDDLPRFFKLAHLIYTYMLNDPSVKSLIDRGLRPAGHLLPVHEFLFFVSDAWSETTPA